MTNALFALAISAWSAEPTGWDQDFAHQPLASRPALEVRYVDGTRTAFEIEAQAYHLIGELRTPHRLLQAPKGEEWLSLEVQDDAGRSFSTRNAKSNSRINLYRRGPYFCEIHWMDLQLADPSGKGVPLKGDLALYCYPDKILGSITWHGLDAFPAREVRVKGIAPATFTVQPFEKGTVQTCAFPLFGETEPLPASAFDNLQTRVPVRYDAVRGCYAVGSQSEGGFQGHFYHHPNRYETVRFAVQNEGSPRRITVCHETVAGDQGSVEGGVILDQEGHPLPVLVQISKNFAGEKEEPFYNPNDTPFSETYFPLYLGPNETRTLSSLHLYQNWGRHPVKQFSSLGAWMDYFHSSTGVTETTCYVPFKFGGLPGVDIADLRAMSQSSFWGGQPQHDNVAGHSFLSHLSDAGWQYMEYRDTSYRSTGPNWMDIGFEQVSTDGAIRAEIRTFELPQTDELRNFIRVRYNVIKPLRIKDPRENFRLLRISSKVQRLRYTQFECSTLGPLALDFSKEGFPVKGQPLPTENAFAAVYGDARGSNAMVVMRWTTSVKAVAGPAVSVWCDPQGESEMSLVPNADELDLKPGDFFEFSAIWMPYGDASNANAARQAVEEYGVDAPRLEEISVGTRVSDFPPEVKASKDEAEFTVRGGKNSIPVIVTGLGGYRWPALTRLEQGGWKRVSQARVGDLDGAQTFIDDSGQFGAAFLIPSDGRPQRLRVQAGRPAPPGSRIALRPVINPEGGLQHGVLIQAPWMDTPITLRFPETLMTDGLDFIDHHREDMLPRAPSGPLAQVWQESEAGSLWFEWTFDNQIAGGRLTPNEEDVDLEFWLHNQRKDPVRLSLQFCAVLANTLFDDRLLDRSWVHVDGAWKRMSETDRGGGRRELCHYPVLGGPPVQDVGDWGGSRDVADAGLTAVVSQDGQRICAVAWPHPRSLVSNALIPCIHADPSDVTVPPGQRAYLRGKLYLLEGALDDVLSRARREVE